MVKLFTTLFLSCTFTLDTIREIMCMDFSKGGKEAIEVSGVVGKRETMRRDE